MVNGLCGRTTAKRLGQDGGFALLKVFIMSSSIGKITKFFISVFALGGLERSADRAISIDKYRCDGGLYATRPGGEGSRMPMLLIIEDEDRPVRGA